ncbi:MAG: ribonuclease P protein component 4 [Candidatus Asgardarchaeia archaeon]
MSRKRNIHNYIKDIALQRIEILLKKAKETMDIDPKLSSDYVNLILRLVKKSRVRLPKNYKMWICKKCKRLLIPGKTARVRIRTRRTTHITITCLNCGNIKRYIVKK